jgi:cyclic pyranopterin phosphate synthase
MSKLTHVDEAGRVNMVDVSGKDSSLRVARAAGELRCKPETLEAIDCGKVRKGDVLAAAEIAGVMAAKRTAELIPLCHPLPLTKVTVRADRDPELPGFRVGAEVRGIAQTGFEMEALTAVTVAALTLFDMLKAIDRTMVINRVEVVSKSGGRSGNWHRER